MISSPRMKRVTFSQTLVIVLVHCAVTISSLDVTCTREVPCSTGVCTITTECVHGDCTDKGICRCQGCWDGEACDVYENFNKPYFSESEYDVYVTESPIDGQHVFTATAYDDDEEDWTASLSCVKVVYGISSGNTNFAFRIDRESGRVFIRSVDKLVPENYKLTITAVNEQIEGELIEPVSTVTLTIHFQDPSESSFKLPDPELNGESFPFDGEANEPHHRSRRAADPLLPIPTNVTFTLVKEGIYENVTTMRVGEKVSFKLMIHFPIGVTDMIVELFTPDNETTVMKLCNPRITHIGSNLAASLDGTSALPEMDSKDGSTNYDRAILDLKTVDNTGADVSNHMPSMVFIEYDALMIHNPSISNNSKHWVSAGVEYNNEDEIWIGQAAFEALLDDMAPIRSPSFNMSGPSEIALESSAVFTVDMYIPHPSTSVRVDVFAPFNTTSVMSVCGIVIQSTADNFACLPYDSFTAQMSKSDSGEGNWHGSIDLGTVTNAGSRDESLVSEDDRITVSFMAYMFDGSVVNESYEVGVAVELGESLIWAARAPIKVIEPPALVEMTEVPTFSFNPVTGIEAQVNRPSIIELDMIVPMNTESKYELEVVTPDNTTLNFKICSISIIYIGDNVACVRKNTAFYSKEDNSTFSSRAVLPMGLIKNSGVKVNVLASTIRIEIVVQALNTTGYSPSDKYWVTMGMNFTEKKIWVGQQAFTVAEPPPDEETTNPSFVMEYSFGTDTIPVGDSRAILYKMTTVKNATYEPAYIEVIMPDNITDDGASASLFTICKVEVIFAGRNVPCLNKTEASNDVIYEDKHNRGKKDKAMLSLGNICNTGRYSDPDDDMVIFSVLVKVEDHPVLSNGTREWVSVGIMLTNETLWVGQVAVYAVRDMMISSNPSGEAPYLGVEMLTNLTGDVPSGYIVTYSIIVKLPPESSLKYEINVTAKSADLSLCGLRIVEYGDHLPCMDLSAQPVYTQYPDTHSHNTAYMDLGPITSYSPKEWTLNRTNTVMADTIRLEVTVKLSRDALDLSSHNLDVLLTLSDGVPVTETVPITATTDMSNVNSNDTVEAPPIVSFYAVDLRDTEGVNKTYEIGRGEARRFITDVIIPTPFLSEVVVKFFTPLDNSGEIEICGAQLISTGENVPCLAKSFVKTQYEQRADPTINEVATLDLGYVCQVPFFEFTNETNMIRLESIMKVKNDSTLTSAIVSSSVKVGDTYIILTDLNLQIKDEITQPDFVYLNDTNTTIPSISFNMSSNNMTIGEIMTLGIIISIPANTSGNTLVDMKMPVNESAELTIEAIRVTSAGQNLACFDDFENLNISFISSQKSSQNDAGYVDFGTIFNTGFTYRSDKYEEADDQLVIEFDVQMADSIENENDSWHKFSAAIEYGGIIILVSQNIQVIRLDSEKPDLEIIAESNITDPLSPSDTVMINAVLKHLNTSTAEGINVTANFYLPPYVTYLSLNYSSLEASVDKADGSLVRVQFPRLFFTDIVFFSVLLQVLSNASSPVSLIDTITPFEAGSTMHYRPDNTYLQGAFFTTEFQDISYKIRTTPESGCSEALGMEDGRIQDCQISGSISPDVTKMPHHGRLNGGSGWSPFRRYGKHNEQRHMEVYFGNKTKVSHIKIKHPAYASFRASQLQIFYSNDGQAWLPGEKMIPSVTNYVTDDLPVLTPRESRYIRLYVLSNQNLETDLVGLQVEFFGCHISSDVIEACPTTPTIPPATEYTERSFLTTDDEVFVCDAQPNIDLSMSCVTSADGTTWKELDPSVANVIGYNPTTQELFGIGADKVSYVMSLDRGQSWSCIVPSTWSDVKAASIKHIPVPWTYSGDLSGANPVASYIQDTWGALADGMYENTGTWAKRLDWSNCC